MLAKNRGSFSGSPCSLPFRQACFWRVSRNCRYNTASPPMATPEPMIAHWLSGLLSLCLLGCLLDRHYRRSFLKTATSRRRVQGLTGLEVGAVFAILHMAAVNAGAASGRWCRCGRRRGALRSRPCRRASGFRRCRHQWRRRGRSGGGGRWRRCSCPRRERLGACAVRWP